MFSTIDTSLWGQGKLDWSFLLARLNIPAAEHLPIPLPNANDKVALEVSFHLLTDLSSSTSGVKFQLQFDITYELASDVSIPFWGGKIGRTCHLKFIASFENEDELRAAHDLWESPHPAGVIKGSVEMRIRLKLPTLPDLGMIHLTTGDAEGWVTLQLKVSGETGGAGSSLTLQAEIKDQFTAEIQFPGLAQPTAPVRLEMYSFGGSITAKNSALSGTLTGDGRLTFRPRMSAIDVPIAEYLKPILEQADFRIEAHVECTLGIDIQGEPVFLLSCTFENLGVKINLLETLEQMMRGVSAPTGVPAAAEANCKKYSEFGFELNGVWLQLSREPSFAIQMSATLAGIKPPLPVYLAISTKEVRVGLGNASPLWQLFWRMAQRSKRPKPPSRCRFGSRRSSARISVS